MSRASKHPISLAALWAAGLCACSSPDPASPNESGGAGGAASQSGASSTAGGAGSGSSAGGAAGSSAGNGGASSGSSAGGEATSAQHHGQVALFNLIADNRVSMTADFVDSSTPGAPCLLTTDGACTAAVCPEGAAAKNTHVSAGMLSATSPEVMGSVTALPAADNTYSMIMPMFAHVFSGLEHAVFKASGGTVPAFEEQLQMPLVLLLSQPPFVKGMTGIDVERSQDLALTWTRGVAGTLLYISGGGSRSDGQPGSAGLTCQFPSEAGAATVKASTLQLLVTGTQLSLLTVSTKTVTAGDYAVALAVVNGVTNPDKVVIPRLQLH